MQISVVIVNYNVKYFLEQCLSSVQKATETIQAEIIVVDNASNDGSIAYLQPLFPRVKFIGSPKNLGFAKANNLAFKQSKGDFVLVLNPDTILPEDCIINCLEYFKVKEDCGALGVRMIDGSGKFLPESKRSFPSLSAAFCKLIGLSALFPHSKIFNAYALGHLNKNDNYEVDVLAGAFIMLKKEVIEVTNGFDETFFMYGEDIDLSYRIQHLGFKNYYFGKQSIIHFKGESTKRGSLNYIRMFYNAMVIFIKKHYRGSKATFFSATLNIAIWLRALVTLFQNLINKSGLLIIDAIIVYAVLFFTKTFWIEVLRNGKPFDGDFEQYSLPVYTVIFFIGALLSGIYDNLYKPLKALLASATAVIVLLAFYSLLPENFRFSRGVILAGGILSGIMVTLIRWIFIKLDIIKNIEDLRTKQTLVIGSQTEYIQVLQLLNKSKTIERIEGRVGINADEENSLGSIYQLKEIIKQLGINEIIFCEGAISYKEIIELIVDYKKEKISFKFHAKKSHSIVGSDSKVSTGEALTVEGVFALTNPYQMRMKRMIDIWISIMLFATFPIQFLLLNNYKKGLKNAWLVLVGKKTWVGYSSFQNTLPLLAPGVLLPSGYPKERAEKLNRSLLKKGDALYAREYDWLQDLKIIFENYAYLGGD